MSSHPILFHEDVMSIFKTPAQLQEYTQRESETCDSNCKARDKNN